MKKVKVPRMNVVKKKKKSVNNAKPRQKQENAVKSNRKNYERNRKYTIEPKTKPQTELLELEQTPKSIKVFAINLSCLMMVINQILYLQIDRFMDIFQ